MAYTKMEFYDWCDKYKPIANPNGTCKDDYLFQVCQEDIDYLNKQNIHNIWTDIGRTVINGAHFVNRICYYLTEIPWEDGDDIEIFYDEDDMDEDDDDDDGDEDKEAE